MSRRVLRYSAFAVLAFLTAGLLYVGAVAFGVFSGEYGLHPGADARDWAAHPISYAASSQCAACHNVEAARLDSNLHAPIGCQSCHGPLEAHVLEATPTTVSVPIPVPGPEICLRCHTTAEARPGTIPQVTPANHYTDACLDCHDPHTGISVKPPHVSHPIARLPACITCHGPEGLRARSPRHPKEATDDVACLKCHALTRGQIDVTVSQ